jgi:hypothetical protein
LHAALVQSLAAQDAAVVGARRAVQFGVVAVERFIAALERQRDLRLLQRRQMLQVAAQAEIDLVRNDAFAQLTGDDAPAEPPDIGNDTKRTRDGGVSISSTGAIAIGSLSRWPRAPTRRSGT